MFNKSFSVIISKKIKSYKKGIKVDSDKSISIRSFLIGSISHNISKVENALESDDVFSAINCLRRLGVKILKQKSGKYLIYGKGLGSLSIKRNSTLNFGNSGTLARLLIGILSTTPNIKVKIKGDKSLNKRNMSKVIKLMSEFGAEFRPKNKLNLPLRLTSSEMPVGIHYKSGISAQLKSAVILAGINSFGTTTIIEKKESRDHTENILLKNSSNTIKIKKSKKKQNLIKIYGKNYLEPLDLYIPGDPSSGAFFTALTLLNKKSLLKIKNVCLNPKRIGFYKLLKKHGGKISFKNIKKKNNEIIGDIIIKSSKLRSIKAGPKYYTSSTDEYPIMFVLAALTPGTSVFTGIEDLANKESNRIEEMKKILKQIGVKCISSKNKMIIRGLKNYKFKNKVINVPNLSDHRLCMSASILGLITGIKTKIKNFETVKTSCPSFLKIVKLLGGEFEIKKN